MAFGPIMQMTVRDLAIELAPISKEHLHFLVSPGLQQYSTTKYTDISTPTIEDEVEWYDKVRTDESTVLWGVWDVSVAGKRTLIGTTELADIQHEPLKQAVSGVGIIDKAYWGRSIASTIHLARTWYAFEQLGLVRIKSAVIQGNIASKKALEKSGYFDVSVERNVAFIDGRLRHQDNLECLNPADWAWDRWWGDDQPTNVALDARKKTQDALDWAKENVVFL